MAYDRPPITQIKQRILADFQAELPGSEPIPAVTTEYAFAVAVAGASHLMHGRIDYGLQQQLPDTADEEGVSRWAGILGMSKVPAQKSAGTGGATGVATTAIPMGSTLVSPVDDLVYVTTSAAVLDTSGEATLDIEAQLPGAAYNKTLVSTLEFSPAITDVDSTVTINGGIDFVTKVPYGLVGGADLETTESLAERIGQRFSEGKLVGKPGDWARWARLYPGVTRAWEVPGIGGPNAVTVFFVIDNDPISIFPSSPLIALVEASVEAEAPSPAITICDSPLNDELVPTITISPDTPEIRTAVQAELEDLMLREATAAGFTLPLSKITEAISRAPGEESNTLLSPTADQVYPVGTIPTVGNITWV